MRLKSLFALALLPLLTSCADCTHTVKYESFMIGFSNIFAPIEIKETRMPINWRLLTENLPTFELTEKITRALDDKQFAICERLKTAGDNEREALKAEYNTAHVSIDELAEVLQSPLPEVPRRLREWNEKWKYVVEEGQTGEGTEKKPAEEKKPEEGSAPKNERPAPGAAVQSVD